MPLGHIDRSSRSDPPMTRPRSGRWGTYPTPVGETSNRSVDRPWVATASISKRISSSVEDLRVPPGAAKFQLESLILAQNER
jgi:hypothetical protein